MIAKASTTCTYSLDPIALRTPEFESGAPSEALFAASHCAPGIFTPDTVENLVDAITIDACSSHASIDFHKLLKNSR